MKAEQALKMEQDQNITLLNKWMNELENRETEPDIKAIKEELE